MSKYLLLSTLLFYALTKTEALIDCNAWKYDCKRWWGTDPTCASKQNACHAAANAFFAYTGSVEAICANDILNGNQHGRDLIEDAKDVLYEKELFAPSDFDGIQIQFCTALQVVEIPNIGSWSAYGMVPSSNKILLHPDYLNENSDYLALLLAHEMVHIQQHRRWSSVGFGCRYQEELWSGNGQGRKNSIEKEAYKFEDEAWMRMQGTKIALQVHDGSYVLAIDGGGGAVKADAKHIHDWESFWLIQQGDGAYAFQTCDLHYLQALNGGGGLITAQALKALEWESFSLACAQPPCCFLCSTDNGRYSIQAYNGQYLAAKDGGGDILEANRDKVDIWERFRIVLL